MIIRNIEGAEINYVESALQLAIADSRFTAEVGQKHLSPHRWGLEIRQVRLVTKKEFCGNHPNECASPPDRKHPKGSWLEGADWVEFNDLINDVLDRLNVSADAFSKPREIAKRLFLRHGGMRRVRYDSFVVGQLFFGTAYAWLHDDYPNAYMDCRGREAPRSGFLDGTPGIHSQIDYECVG